MFPNFSNIQKLFFSTIYDFLHPKGRYFRLVIAFWIGMFFKIILMDFEVFSKHILSSRFTEGVSILLIKISSQLFQLINIPVHLRGRTLAIYDTVGVLINDSCLGLRGIILFTFF